MLPQDLFRVMCNNLQKSGLRYIVSAGPLVLINSRPKVRCRSQRLQT